MSMPVRSVVEPSLLLSLPPSCCLRARGPRQTRSGPFTSTQLEKPNFLRLVVFLPGTIGPQLLCKNDGLPATGQSASKDQMQKLERMSSPCHPTSNPSNHNRSWAQNDTKRDAVVSYNSMHLRTCSVASRQKPTRQYLRRRRIALVQSTPWRFCMLPQNGLSWML